MNTTYPGAIIAAVDGSSSAERATCWAAEQAFLERRQLVVVHVISYPDGVVPAGITTNVVQAPAPGLPEHANAVLEGAFDVAHRHRPGISVLGVAIFGDARAMLLELARTAHMLVLGSHGRGVIGSKLLGSVGVAVAKRARCPVVVCRPGSELTVKNGVLVGADGAPDSIPAIEFAFQQAAFRMRPLTVVHCIAGALGGVSAPHVITGGTEPGLEAARLVLAESVAGFREKFPEVHVELKVARGLAVDCLAAAAPHHDLVVVGRRDLTGLGRTLAGGVSSSVIEHAPTYIAVVPA